MLWNVRQPCERNIRFHLQSPRLRQCGVTSLSRAFPRLQIIFSILQTPFIRLHPLFKSGKMSPINSLWFKWKSLRLPWRKMFLVGKLSFTTSSQLQVVAIVLLVSDESSGQDLSGNTFWEFKDAVNANRLRRIVRYNPRSHYADVKITRKVLHGTGMRKIAHKSHSSMASMVTASQTGSSEYRRTTSRSRKTNAIETISPACR